MPLITQTHNVCDFRHTITRCVDHGNSSNRPSASRVPQASRCRCRTGCSPRPARRQNRASVLAGWLLATGPMQKSQTKPSCFRIHEAPAFSPTSPKAARCPTQAATQVWQASWALSRGSTRRTPPAGTEVAGTGRTIPRTRALRRKAGVRISAVPSSSSLALSPRSKRAQPRLGTIALVLVSAWGALSQRRHSGHENQGAGDGQLAAAPMRRNRLCICSGGSAGVRLSRAFGDQRDSDDARRPGYDASRRSVLDSRTSFSTQGQASTDNARYRYLKLAAVSARALAAAAPPSYPRAASFSFCRPCPSGP